MRERECEFCDLLMFCSSWKWFRNGNRSMEGIKLAWELNPHLNREIGETSGIGTDCPVITG